MDDTAVEIAKLNETATDLLNKYDNAFDSIDERKDEALNKIKDAYDSGKVAMAENALKLEGKSLQEITEQINTQSILNKPKVKLLQNNNLIDLPAGLNESQSLTLKIEDFDKYTKYFVTTTKGDISLDQNTGEITLKAHEILSDINEELTIEVYYKIGSALSEIFTYKFTVFFLPYEEFTLSNADLKANSEDMDGFEFDGTDAVALEDNAFYKEVETKVDDLKVVGETTLLYKGKEIIIESESTSSSLVTFSEINENDEIWIDSKKGELKNINTSIETNNLVPKMTSNISPSGKVIYSSLVSGQSYSAFDKTNGAWGTNILPAYVGYEFPELTTITQYTITVPGEQQPSYSKTQSPKTWKFQGAMENEWITLDTQENQTNWGINEKRTFNIAPSKYKKYKLLVTETNGHNYVVVTEIELKAITKNIVDISSFNLTQTPTSAQLDTNIDISTSVQTSANKIISGEPLKLNIDSTSTTTSLVTRGKNLYEGDKLVIDGEEGTLGTVTHSIGSINTHDIFGDNSAIATYQFDGNVNDLSGNYNGTWSDDGAYIDGIFKQAGKFRSTRYLNTTISKMPESYSVSSWVRYSDVSAYGSILGNAGSNGHNGFSFRASGTNSNYSIDVYSHSQSSSARVSINGSNYINKNNEWYHILCTYDKNTNTMKVYINGILIGTDTSGSAITQTSSMNLTVGKNLSTHTSSSFWNSGDIDQLRIFNRALTNSEIQRLYNEEISKFTADISSFSLNNKPKKAYKKQNDKSCITIGTPTTTNISVLNKKQNLITQGQKIFLEDVNKYVDVDSVNESTIQHGISNKEFETVLYKGNGNIQTVNLNNINTGVDFVWIKKRNNIASHRLYDSTRGINNQLYPDTIDAEGSASNSLLSFNSNNIVLGDSASINENSSDFVAWCASLPNKNTNNTDGTITSITMSNSFMSVISYTGNGNSNSSVGHGLGSTPEFVIIKNRDVDTHGWWVWSSNFTQNEYLVLNEHYPKKNNGYQSNDYHGILPNSSTISLGYNSHWTNFANEKFICYSFKSIPELCKVGSYTGTGTSGNNIDCGFEPAWIMIKGIDDTSEWLIFDYQRGSDNSVRANRDFVEENFDYIDFNSTGFECKNNQPSTNTSGNKYMYVAIAKNTEQTTQRYNITHKAQTSPATGVGLMDTFKTNQILNKTFDGSKISTTLAGQDNIEGEFIQRKIIADKDTKILAPITTSLKKEA